LAAAQCTEALFGRRAVTAQAGSDPAVSRVRAEVALWAATLRSLSPARAQLLRRMVLAKLTDLYAYQRLLLRFTRPAAAARRAPL
jgi:hypothetical protein